MAARGLDAIVLWGWPVMWDFYTANARYLAPIGGNAEFNVLVFPADGDPTSIVQMPTFLEGWRAAVTVVTRRDAKAHIQARRMSTRKPTEARMGRDPDS